VNNFFQAYQLIHTLSKAFSNLPVTNLIFFVLQILIKFWKNVLPPVENGNCYSTDQFSQGSDYLHFLLLKILN
jgi:hypothetical protein